MSAPLNVPNTRLSRNNLNSEQNSKRPDSNPYSSNYRKDLPVALNENNNFKISNFKRDSNISVVQKFSGAPIYSRPNEEKVGSDYLQRNELQNRGQSEFPKASVYSNKEKILGPNNYNPKTQISGLSKKPDNFSNIVLKDNSFKNQIGEKKNFEEILAGNNIDSEKNPNLLMEESKCNANRSHRSQLCGERKTETSKKIDEQKILSNPENKFEKDGIAIGIAILQRIIFEENNQILMKLKDNEKNNIAVLEFEIKKLFDEKKDVNFNQVGELRKKNEEITNLKNEINILRSDRDQILNELNEIKEKNKELKVASKEKTKENEKLREKSVFLKEKLKKQESQNSTNDYDKIFDVKVQMKSIPNKDELLIYDLTPKSFNPLFKKYQNFMVIEKQRGESEKISEILPLKDYFKENEKNLKNSTKLSEKVKSKISHLRILANDKNSFYRAIGFAYLEDLFLENLNVKKEKLFKDLKIYKLINQLELECKLEKFIDAKSRKQDILDETDSLKSIFIGGLLYLFKTKILMEEKRKGEDKISKVITDTINADSKFDIALNVFIRSLIFKNLNTKRKEKFFYNAEPDDYFITKTVEKFDIDLSIFFSTDGEFVNEMKGETPESEQLCVNLFFFPDHYDLAYKIDDKGRLNKFK